MGKKGDLSNFERGMVVGIRLGQGISVFQVLPIDGVRWLC